MQDEGRVVNMTTDTKYFYSFIERSADEYFSHRFRPFVVTLLLSPFF